MGDAAMLVRVEPGDNMNRFYEVTLRDDGSVHTRWGRVGEAGRVNPVEHGGQAKFESVVRAKRRKGYKPVDVAGAKSNAAGAARHVLASGDPRLHRLVDRIVAVNAHEIGVASGGAIAVAAGAVTTPLGPLSLAAVQEGRDVLDALNVASRSQRPVLLRRYMEAVPSNVGRRRGWEETFLATVDARAKERSYLDQLAASVQFAQQQQDAAGNLDALFRYRLTVVDDSAVVKRISGDYADTALRGHGGVADARVHAVYALEDVAAQARFDEAAAKLGNVKPHWHGSRAFNILSILARGLMLPTTLRSAQTTGAMFGNGLYGSEMSTKAANYSRGGIWSAGTDARWFLFRADFVMGTECRADRYGKTDWNNVLAGRVMHPQTGKPFDSIYVPGGAGVRNQESIVPSPDRVALRYLVEMG